MPRIPRGQKTGSLYHIINRGNGRAEVFHHGEDYRGFTDLLGEARAKFPVALLAFCLMPNHFHLVIQPRSPEALSAFMQWTMTCHVRRYHRLYRSSGHVWQGRFKSFPIQQDDHLLVVLRYVLRNPVRARLVDRVEQWPWSSFRYPEMIDPWPVSKPRGFQQWTNLPLTNEELMRLRTCVNRQSPFGSPTWQMRIAKAAGLLSTLRPRGRPRKPS
jgi:putative transposase